jgi:hypothetical protein
LNSFTKSAGKLEGNGPKKVPNRVLSKNILKIYLNPEEENLFVTTSYELGFSPGTGKYKSPQLELISPPPQSA